MGMMVVVVRGVMDMEVDKVADMMVEMEVDKAIKVATNHMRWRLTRWTPP